MKGGVFLEISLQGVGNHIYRIQWHLSRIRVALESPLLWGLFSEVFSAGALNRIFESQKNVDRCTKTKMQRTKEATQNYATHKRCNKEICNAQKIQRTKCTPHCGGYLLLREVIFISPLYGRCLLFCVVSVVPFTTPLDIKWNFKTSDVLCWKANLLRTHKESVQQQRKYCWDVSEEMNQHIGTEQYAQNEIEKRSQNISYLLHQK